MKIEILPYPELSPLEKVAKKLVVFLHGVGSDGNDLITLAPFMQKELPDVHFISPHGVEAFDMAPFGRQWFSLNDRSPTTIYKLVEKNIASLSQIITNKQAELGLSNKDTVIIGFSQGSMIGLYLNLIQEEPFAAMVAFSGRLIPPQICNNKSTPICIIHGEDDDVVDIREMDIISEYLSERNIPCISHKIPNLTHSIDAKGLELATNFIITSTTDAKI